jgi:hypothetical protein
VRIGSRVRLRPRKGGDVMDIALAGQIATIECIEQDYEGKQHVCVVLDNDPGKDMGLLRQPGHRFFFDAEEVEPLAPDEVPARFQRHRNQPFSSPASATSLWAMTRLAWKWFAAWPAGSCQREFAWPILAFAVSTWPMRCKTVTKPQFLWTLVRTARLPALSMSSNLT